MDFKEKFLYHLESFQEGKQNVCHVIDARERTLDDHTLIDMLNIFSVEISDQIDSDCPTQRSSHHENLVLVNFVAISNIISHCLCIKI